MGCCGAAREDSWEPSNVPLGVMSAFSASRGWALQPVINTVTTSAGASEPCCDACAVEAARESSCASGACGVPMSAGVHLPLNSAGAVDPGALAASWGSAVGVRRPGRQAGFLGPSVARPEPVRADFRRSSDADLRAMTDLELYTRETNLADVILPASVSAATRSEYGAERHNVTLEGTRREDVDHEVNGDPSDEAPPTAEEWVSKRERVARTAAEALAPGTDAASERRRDAIIAQAVTGTFAAFNSYLEREYNARVEGIRGTTSITLARLHNEDREADRTYRLALARLNAGSGGGSGGAATPLLGLGALFLLARAMGGV